MPNQMGGMCIKWFSLLNVLVLIDTIYIFLYNISRFNFLHIMKQRKPIFGEEFEKVEELLARKTGDNVLQTKKQELQELLDLETKNERLLETRSHKTFLMAKACPDRVILRTDGKVEFPKLGRCVSIL